MIHRADLRAAWTHSRFEAKSWTLIILWLVACVPLFTVGVGGYLVYNFPLPYWAVFEMVLGALAGAYTARLAVEIDLRAERRLRAHELSAFLRLLPDHVHRLNGGERPRLDT